MTSSGNSREIDDSSGSSSTEEGKKNRALRLKVLRPMQDFFAKEVDYRTYRLMNTPQQFDSKNASRISKLVKKMRSRLKETDFNAIDPILILACLTEFRDACDNIGTHEGAAMWLISYFMKKPALSCLEALLSPKKICATGLHDESLSCYAKVVS